jgi:hypothetical protein
VQITVTVNALYNPIVDCWPWFQYVFVFGAAVHILYNSLGIWSLGQYRSKFIWATPVTLHGFILVLAVWLLIRSHPWSHLRESSEKRLEFCRFLSLVAVHLTAVILSIVGMVQDWEAQVLVQCLFCMAGNLEYFLWNLVLK